MKILIFEPNWMGDVIFTTPAFPAIKDKYKDSFLGCILTPHTRDLLKYNPFVDEIIEFDERKQQRTLSQKLAFIRLLREKKYDRVFLLHRSLTRTFICYWAGIKERIGYAYKKRAFLLTGKVLPPAEDTLHKQDYYLGVLERFSLEIKDKNCRVYLSDRERFWAEELINKYSHPEDVLIGISPFSNWAPKDWPEDYYFEFIKSLKVMFRNIKFFITGLRIPDRLFSLLRGDSSFVIDLVNKTTLLQLAAIYERMDLVVASDSGPLHLAASVGTPYIGLYGPTSPFLSSPRAEIKGKVLFKNNTCAVPCYLEECKRGFICMRSIKPEEVVSLIQRFFFHQKYSGKEKR